MRSDPIALRQLLKACCGVSVSNEMKNDVIGEHNTSLIAQEWISLVFENTNLHPAIEAVSLRSVIA